MFYNKHVAKSKQTERLNISKKRIILLFIAFFIVLEIVFYFSFQQGQFFPFDTSFYIYTPILLGLTIFLIVVSITQTYYVLDKTKIVHVKMGKTFEYFYKDIIFIDEKWSRKHKMLLFYKNNGHGYYLAFDKEGLILEYALTYSHLISEEEFAMRFPNVKL